MHWQKSVLNAMQQRICVIAVSDFTGVEYMTRELDTKFFILYSEVKCVNLDQNFYAGK